MYKYQQAGRLVHIVGSSSSLTLPSSDNNNGDGMGSSSSSGGDSTSGGAVGSDSEEEGGDWGWCVLVNLRKNTSAGADGMTPVIGHHPTPAQVIKS